MELLELISKISPSDKTSYEKCIDHFDHIAKPIGSLGKLETLLAAIAAASGTADINIKKKCVLVFCADNGVLAQGVAQSTHDVTTAIAKSLVRGFSTLTQPEKRILNPCKPHKCGIFYALCLPNP